MKLFFTLFPLALFLHRCCAPYLKGQTDPLLGETRGKWNECWCQPCAPGTENCLYRPWLNVEYERNYVDVYKVGVTFDAYTSNYMLLFGGNYLLNTQNINGINLIGQVGLFPKNETYTTFVGLDYSRWNKSISSQLLSPHLGYTPPIKYLRNFQFKGGYNIGIRNQSLSGPFVAVNIKLPVFHLL